MATDTEILRAWVKWQKQASLTNDISFAMEARQKQLAVELGRPVTNTDLLNDSQYQTLKANNDTEAAKCEKPFKDFKEIVKTAVE